MTFENKRIAAAILSVALLTVMAGAAISPAIAPLADFFANAGRTRISLVQTLTPLMVIPFAMGAGRLTRRFGKKRVLLAGLFVYLAAGMGGGLAHRMDVLLLTRALLGMAVGLIMPVSTALVSDFFDNDQAPKMMGWISASNHFGGMAAQILSGILATFSWRYAFGAYGLGVIAVFLVIYYLPEPKISRPSQDRRSLKTNNGASGRSYVVYLYAVAIFLLMIVFYTIPINLSLFINKNQMGNTISAGMAFALVTGAAFTMGLCFYRLRSSMPLFSPCIALAIMAAGFGILSISKGMAGVFAGACLIGTGEGYLLPYIFNGVRTSVDSGSTVNAMAVVSSGMYLGQFFSPIIIHSVAGLWLSNKPAAPFAAASFLSTGAAVVSLLTIWFIKQKNIKNRTLKGI